MYEAVLAGRFAWISEKVFLRIAKVPHRRSLDWPGRAAQRRRPAVEKLADGNLHLYAFPVLAGIVRRADLSWRNGDACF